MRTLIFWLLVTSIGLLVALAITLLDCALFVHSLALDAQTAGDGMEDENFGVGIVLLARIFIVYCLAALPSTLGVWAIARHSGWQNRFYKATERSRLIKRVR